MPKPLAALRAYRQGELSILEQHPWLRFLAEAEERHVNYEHVRRVADLADSNPVLDYVERTLTILESLPVSFWMREMLEQVLAWSEVAKGGTYLQRKAWHRQGFNLLAHNEGSARIYASLHSSGDRSGARIVETLIATHGLLGQHLRGEVPLSEHRPLSNLVQEGLLRSGEMHDLLINLNQCVIGGVSPGLWKRLSKKVEACVNDVVAGRYDREPDLWERLRRLRAYSISAGEDFAGEFDRNLSHPAVLERLQQLLPRSLWYVEGALSDFSFGEFVKVLLLTLSAPEAAAARHLHFEPLMKGLHYDRQGIKKTNLFKKRIIEQYLRDLPVEAILSGDLPAGPHVAFRPDWDPAAATVFADFACSPAGEALIRFCVEAERAGSQYEQATLLLYDFFGFRRDAYDRLHAEEPYLQQMNASADHKAVMLPFVVGDTVLDVGPGGGAMLDRLAAAFPEKRVVGIDVARNVVEALERRRHAENRPWEIVRGDALALSEHFPPGSVSTVLFSSVLHELFSYLPYHGRRFNHGAVKAALGSAFEILAPGGRIIIRDGIMTEPKEQRVIIRFRSDEGMECLKQYCQDFRGRPITFLVVGHLEAQMLINDAMEFLYTYTWGDEAYVHEVQEQFGYFTPSEFEQAIAETLGPGARILENRHYLQPGYTLALESKIEFLDERRRPIPLPDSTCLIVIEKAF